MELFVLISAILTGAGLAVFLRGCVGRFSEGRLRCSHCGYDAAGFFSRCSECGHSLALDSLAIARALTGRSPRNLTRATVRSSRHPMIRTLVLGFSIMAIGFVLVGTGVWANLAGFNPISLRSTGALLSVAASAQDPTSPAVAELLRRSESGELNVAQTERLEVILAEAGTPSVTRVMRSGSYSAPRFTPSMPPVTSASRGRTATKEFEPQFEKLFAQRAEARVAAKRRFAESRILAQDWPIWTLPNEEFRTVSLGEEGVDTVTPTSVPFLGGSFAGPVGRPGATPTPMSPGSSLVHAPGMLSPAPAKPTARPGRSSGTPGAGTADARWRTRNIGPIRYGPIRRESTGSRTR